MYTSQRNNAVSVSSMHCRCNQRLDGPSARIGKQLTITILGDVARNSDGEGVLIADSTLEIVALFDLVCKGDCAK